MDKEEKPSFGLSSKKSGPFKIRWGGLSFALFWAIFLGLVLANLISPYLSQIVQGLLSGIAPLIIGIVVAFVFYRLVNFTERVVLKNAFKNSPYKFGIKRTISIFVVLVFIVGMIVLICSILIPKIVAVILELTAQSGSGWNDLVRRVVDEITALLNNLFGLNVEQESIKEAINAVLEYLSQTLSYLNNILGISMTVVTWAFNFLIGILLAILMLKDKEKISRFTKRFVYSHMKRERADELCVMTHNSSKILFDYIICKLIEFAIFFVSLGIVYAIIGLPFSWELSLIIGIFNFIPYFGIYIGAIPCLLISLIFGSMNAVLYMAIATIIITTIEGNTIIPIITGNKLKVSALVVISSIIIGGAMFGIVGMFLAPPIASILSVIITGNIELRENHMKYVMELDKVRAENEQQMRESFEIESNSPVEPQAKIKNATPNLQQATMFESPPALQKKSVEKSNLPKEQNKSANPRQGAKQGAKTASVAQKSSASKKK